MLDTFLYLSFQTYIILRNNSDLDMINF